MDNDKRIHTIVKTRITKEEILNKDTSNMPPEEKQKWERMKLWLTDYNAANKLWKKEEGFNDDDSCGTCIHVIQPNPMFPNEWKCQLILDTMRENNCNEKFAIVDEKRDICGVYERQAVL
ncbi:MAG: hypothetical protein LBM77_08140 [Spirochaetaceae bacterium]|jgi:hypothetical protein|nr:hypothetical protein [Spirochaetaceae bacterium]